MLIWRGWGWLVFIIPLIWIPILFTVVYYLHPQGSPASYLRELGVSDRVRDYYSGAMLLAISAVTLWPISHYRSRVVPPGHDHFYYVPMKYCTYLLAAGAVGLYFVSLFVT
jgi:hypothetical protein